MTTTAKKAATGVTAAVLSFLLYAQREQGLAIAELQKELALERQRTEFFHGLKTLDEIKAHAESGPKEQ